VVTSFEMAIQPPESDNRDNIASRGTWNICLVDSIAAMNRPKLVRSLRIAWSVTWGLACFLLIALWVRSYYREYSLVFGVSDHRGFLVDSSTGILLLIYYHEFGTPPTTNQPRVALSRWWLGSSSPDQFITSWGFQRRLSMFRRDSSSGNITVTMPHWFFVLLSAMMATVPWLRVHFSLRTLLIATTLVAVGLGLIVWLR
jgi:hypothetical protein